MNTFRNIYKVARGILFTAIILIAVVYLAIYILLSVPSFQDYVKKRVEKEVSEYVGSTVEIGKLDVLPFNEVRIHGLVAYDLQGKRCLEVETLGAGIHLWRLIKQNRIELTYTEIIGLDVAVSQPDEKSPLNIQFIIDAFKPKDKSKKPKKFDLNLRNVVLRRCGATFDREWIPRKEGFYATDFNHLRISDLKGDLNLPRISNDDYQIDLRRLSFSLSGGLSVESISFKAHVTSKSLTVENLVIKLPGTEIMPSDISLSYDGFGDIIESLKRSDHHLILVDNPVMPSDFSWLVPDLRKYRDPFVFSLDVKGNFSDFRISRFDLSSEHEDIFVSLYGDVSNLGDKRNFCVSADDVKLKVSAGIVSEILHNTPGLPEKLSKILTACGDMTVSATGNATPYDGNYEADCRIETMHGDMFLSAQAQGVKEGRGHVAAEVSAEQFDLGKILDNPQLGETTAEVIADGTLNGKDVDGVVEVYVSDIFFRGNSYGGLVAKVEKEMSEIKGELTCDNEIAKLDILFGGSKERSQAQVDLEADIKYLKPSMLGFLPKYEGYTFSGIAAARLNGRNIDDVEGEIMIDDLNFYAPEKKSVSLESLAVRAEKTDSLRRITLVSDWVDGEIKGNFRMAEVVGQIKSLVSKAMPSLMINDGINREFNSNMDFSFRIKPENTLPEFFNLPFRLLVDIPVTGTLNSSDSSACLSADIPYLQQGKNKLVRDTKLRLGLEGSKGIAKVEASTTFPAKKGDMSLGVNILSSNDNVFADVNWETIGNSFLKGALSLGARINRNELSRIPEVSLDINPSVFEFGTTQWNIDRSNISYNDGSLDVDGLRIWHGAQYVDINGRASKSASDSIAVRLADIDVGYIFDTLNINYVAFGGTATGDITASGVLGKEPRASTDNLLIRQLSYNGSVLGDGTIESHWDNRQKEVTITADILGDRGNRSKIDGGIWVTRDSLSFEIDADRVPVGFLSPFMSAFASDVKGRASGNAKLFGTFSDIDLVGRILADSVAIKLDYTNVWYHGTDSVFLNPGKIVIPSFRLYDREGHSAVLSGELTHRYFHEPRFNFRISDVKGMLCYDTNAKINPDWYGTFYGDGNAVVRGWPGTVSVSVDMTAVGKSNFTFVLNDTQAAEDYRFLTFSDRRKEEEEKLKTDTVSPILAAFQKKMERENEAPSKFMIDIRGTVTPSTLMTLVMDPVAGDKITARGNGNLQVDYDSESDEMQMFGKYTLEEGNYNFSLQDLILRDFTIRQGSSISFNGDPFNAQLNITAAYRVNTNLSDLDKSFSTDRDLARTNVPVDAMLMVDGEMQHPDISFDIELPTLTQDVERKVKSIISTDDMMSRQIIYLLALNKFYTPEYMGSSSNGGELAAVASSTLSSQLSNMLGQLTDKFTVAPSFRSDKGDFSDIEVDVALSSRLLNNRLLINGNFGYRDRSTSQTTFVGDFDLEYILNRSGNLRLKAYNHFNDQNYYLRQALTTQGLGLIYRKDFDNPFSFLRKKKKDDRNDKTPETTPPDDTALPADSIRHDEKEDEDTLLRFNRKRD